MNPKPFVIKPSDRTAALSVIGTKVTVLASRAETRDQQITLQSGDEGTGPPPHSHDWEESFYVTRGQIQFMCGVKPLCAQRVRSYMFPAALSMRSAMDQVAVKCWKLREDEAMRLTCSPH